MREVLAPAKLTVSLAVVGVRADGLHELRAEMLTLDLADRLLIEELDGAPSSLEILVGPGSRAEQLGGGPENLVRRALDLVGRSARVCLEKRIPVQGGLGGGSADAAAVLRWAGWQDLEGAASLGADVPFCLAGGRAEVSGIGERVRPLPYLERSFVLLVPPFGSDTGAVYRAYDQLAGKESDRPRERRNELTDAALSVEPRLGAWAEALAQLSGREPFLAGSGSTWFVEGELEDLVPGRPRPVRVGGEEGQLLAARSVPAGWPGEAPEPSVPRPGGQPSGSG